MYKKIFSGLLLCTTFLYIVGTGFSTSLQDKALIIYDRRNYFSEEIDIIGSVEALLQHYEIHITSINQNEYEKGKLKEFSHIVFIGLKNGIENNELLDEMQTADKKIFWAGKGIQHFLEEKHIEELIYTGQTAEPVEIHYKESIYRLQRMETFQKISIETPHGKKIATAYDGLHDEPLVIQYEDLMIQTAVQGDGILFYILGDALLTFFSKDYSKNQWEIYQQFEGKKISKEYVGEKKEIVPQEDKIYMTSNMGTKVLAVFIGAVCIIFLLLFLFLRRKGRRNLF